MSDFEDGEILSDDDSRGDAGDVEGPNAPYTPLPRPTPQAAAQAASPRRGGGECGGTRPRSATNSSMMVNVGDVDESLDDPVFDDAPPPAPLLPDHHELPPKGETIRSSGDDDDDSDDDDDDDGLLDESSEDDDSSDSNCGMRLPADARDRKKKKRPKLLPRITVEDTDGPRGPVTIREADDGGGEVFQRMAAQFQREREMRGLPARGGGGKRKNNVWGSILQEESLTQEMTGIGVGRTLRDVESDRGAETYDYVRAQEMEAERRAQREREEKDREEEGLDRELQDYWKTKNPEEDEEEEEEDGGEQNGEDRMETDERRQEALQAGRKRSVRDRLGTRQRGHRHRGDQRMDSRAFEEMSIPPPGMPRAIPELDSESRLCASDPDLGKEMATKLSEPKTQLIVGVVELVGRQVAVDLFERTRRLEADGGMMIKNGERRRTPGGVFLQLLRDEAPVDDRIDEKEVRDFFAQCNRAQSSGRKHHRPRAAFNAELEMFKKLSQERKKKEEERRRQQHQIARGEVDMEEESGAKKEDGEAEGGEEEEEEEEELKPLPDILSCISKRFEEVSKASNAGGPTTSSPGTAAAGLESLQPSGSANDRGESVLEKKPAAFVEPEAPPNSVERVERTLNAYDEEDFLNNDCETEDIELF